MSNPVPQRKIAPEDVDGEVELSELGGRSENLHAPASPLFRRAALDAYENGGAVASLVRIETVTTRALFYVSASVFLAALGIALFGKVEVTSESRGVLRAAQGLYPVMVPVDSVVEKVHVAPGKLVKVGQPLFTVRSEDLEAEKLEAMRTLEALRTRYAEETEVRARRFKAELALLEARTAIQRRQVMAQAETIDRLRDRRAERKPLVDQGYAAKTEDEALQDELARAEQSRMELQAAQAQTGLEIEALKRTQETFVAERDEAIHQAEGRLAAVDLRAGQQILVAPHGGRVEGVTVQAGEVIAANTQLATLVPSDSPGTAILYVPERDRAFLSDGVTVNLEADQLPRGEFGTARAIVRRVPTEVATAAELTSDLGANAEFGSYVRVELDLLDDAQTKRLSRFFSSGTMVTGRVPLRERRVITLALEPLRRWLQ